MKINIKKTTDMILNRAKKRPFGWRSCTQSPNSLELLLEQAYLWNSNSFSHDLPFVWQNGKKKLVELPRQPFGDGRTYGHRDSGNPNDTLVIWKGMFDQFYEESSLAPTADVRGRTRKRDARSDLAAWATAGG